MTNAKLTNTNMTNNCAVCGANLDMVGRSHRCVPKPATVADPVTDGARQPTYKYRDPDKWRAYMRDYMRKKRSA